MQAKANVGRELFRFFRESEDIIANFEGFEELLKRRLTEFLRNDLTEGLEGYLRYTKKRADKYPLENETDKTMCVCFIKGKKGYNIYPMVRTGPLPEISLLYDQFERIVNGVIDAIRKGEADEFLKCDEEKLLYDQAELYIKQKEEEVKLWKV